ncbi:hypothetical protein F5Y11DRAFT_365070 [Daldinia sp. FL1419]|nr:hypothetical protein F5Y11DRAFT_365070 [Daldinia sp. FL1419]
MSSRRGTRSDIDALNSALDYLQAADARHATTQKQYVSPTSVEHMPSRDALYPPKPSTFTLPPAPKTSSDPRTAARKAPQNPFPTNIFPDEDVSSKTEGTRTRANSNKPSTLNEFWNHPGSDWNIKEAKNEKSDQILKKKAGLESMRTGPECVVCGSKLSFHAVTGGRPCLRCNCYN